MSIETPLGDAFDSEDIREMERNNSYLFEERTDKAMIAHRERPYNGQPWTSFGERGKTLIKGLTKRDIGDCIARAFIQSIPPEEGIDGMGWTALIQNTGCNIEKMMGIYPNLPKET